MRCCRVAGSARCRLRGTHAWVGAMVVLVGAVAFATDGDVHTASRWASEVSRLGVVPAEAVYLFDATPEMVEWANARVDDLRADRDVQRLEELQRALFDTAEFEFEYEEALTVTASEAFRLRRGNCMAFTSMFVALARAIGIPAVLVSVKTAPDVERSDGLVIVNKHVVAGYRGTSKLHLFDFSVTSEVPYAHSSVVSDVVASAMYHANIGGARLRSDDLEGARRHLDLATRLAPDWAPAWVNLGVVLHRQDRDDEAMGAYARALETDPSNASAFTNMAVIHRGRGRFDAERAALTAAATTTRNPFTLIAMADFEMARGELARARTLLRRAKWWYPKEPEVYDALARLAVREEEPSRGRRYRNRAEELRQAAK